MSGLPQGPYTVKNLHKTYEALYADQPNLIREP